jgi:hypothetical protein
MAGRPTAEVVPLKAKAQLGRRHRRTVGRRAPNWSRPLPRPIYYSRRHGADDTRRRSEPGRETPAEGIPRQVFPAPTGRAAQTCRPAGCGGGVVRAAAIGRQNSMTGDWSDEETDEPFIADHRDFYKVEKWDQARHEGRIGIANDLRRFR